MTDVMDRESRSRLMSRIRGSDTKPELALRRGLFAMGFRYRLHRKDLPGRPDLTFPRYGAVIFVHGCFWHGHDCALFRMPATRPEFWAGKIEGNRERDIRNVSSLRELGWRVLTVWECAMRGKCRLPNGEAIARTAAWLGSAQTSGHVRGTC